MFYNCINLILIDVSKFDTSNANNMEYMFYNCFSLKSIDVSNLIHQKSIHLKICFIIVVNWPQ